MLGFTRGNAQDVDSQARMDYLEQVTQGRLAETMIRAKLLGELPRLDLIGQRLSRPGPEGRRPVPDRQPTFRA